ncbi:MAG: hypothetical protein LBR92_02445 [Puniceicoccales bacterium]|jgi:flavodoxin|nr:hypothetical protein [Puniceicoccales bacterium]
MSRILVIYYSHSGNTREIAKQIQSVIGGDVFEIKPVKPHPAEYLVYEKILNITLDLLFPRDRTYADGEEGRDVENPCNLLFALR